MTMTEREALEEKMRDAIYGALIDPAEGRPTVETIFCGMDQDIRLGAIADLAISLIISAHEATSRHHCAWQRMAEQVIGDIHQWAKENGNFYTLRLVGKSGIDEVE